MMIEPLMARYLRLKQDLQIAYTVQPWQSARINRLPDDIARTELELTLREHPVRPVQSPHQQLAT